MTGTALITPEDALEFIKKPPALWEGEKSPVQYSASVVRGQRVLLDGGDYTLEGDGEDEYPANYGEMLLCHMAVVKRAVWAHAVMPVQANRLRSTMEWIYEIVTHKGAGNCQVHGLICHKTLGTGANGVDHWFALQGSDVHSTAPVDHARQIAPFCKVDSIGPEVELMTAQLSLIHI